MIASQDNLAVPVSQNAEAWDAAEAAFRLARRQEHDALSERLKASHAAAEALPREERCNWPVIVRLPEVAPFVTAEEEAGRAAQLARRAMIATPAPHWLAFATKLRVVCETLDDLLNPLDLRDRKAIRKRAKDFPGSAIFADLHHAVLGAGTGALEPRFIPDLPKLLSKLTAKVAHALIDDAQDREGFASLQEDALRLAAGGEPISRAPPSRMQEWAAERDRLITLSAGVEDGDDDPYDAEAAKVEQLLRGAPCIDRDTAIGKLEWLRLGFTVGETGAEEGVIDQVIAFLRTLGVREPPLHGDAELLALSEEFERRWAIEHGVGLRGSISDQELDDVCQSTGEIVTQIHKIMPTTFAGLRVRARAVAWQESAYDEPFGEPVKPGNTPDQHQAAAMLINDLIGNCPVVGRNAVAAHMGYAQAKAAHEAIEPAWIIPPTDDAVAATLRALSGEHAA